MSKNTVNMEHGTYKVSEETKAKLVNAAGELFSLRSTNTVTLREIADRAGAVPNAVCYHFGDKEGLVEAVREYALRLWDEERLEKYYQQNETLLTTRDGCRQMVANTIALFFDILCDESQPQWVNRFLLRGMITMQWEGDRHETVTRRILETFCRIYKKITGNDDQITATTWAMAIMAPGAILAASEFDFVHYRKSDGIDYAFLRRLQATVTHNALLSLGLDGKQTT